MNLAGGGWNKVATRWRSRRPFGTRKRSLLSLTILVFVTFCDPFGTNAYYDKVNANITNRWFSYFLAPNATEVVTALVMDADSVAFFDETWPVSYDLHAHLLQTLLDRHEPAALFIDLLFIQRFANPLDSLLTTLVEYKIPVFLATTLNDNGEHLIRPEFVALAEEHSHIKLVGVPKFVDPRDADRYKFLIGSTEDPLHTAAYALYRRLCDSAQEMPWPHCPRSVIRDPPRTCGADLGGTSVPADCSFEVVWRNNPPEHHDRIMAGCEDRPTGLLPDFAPSRCPPHATISAWQLFGPDQARFGALFDDRIVIYGADLSLTADAIVPPTHLALPGLYLHAMAVENLLAYGNRFKSDTATWADWRSAGLPWADLLAHPPGRFLSLLYLLIAWALTENYLRNVEASGGFGLLHHIRNFLGHLFVAVLLLTAMSWFAFSVLGLAINNWISTLFSAFFIMVVVDQITPSRKPAEQPNVALDPPTPPTPASLET